MCEEDLDLLLGLHVDIRRAAALVTLGGDDLVVVRAEVHALGGPGVEVVLHVDRAADALGGADGPVLLKGLRAVDRGLVGARRDVDVVGAAVGVDGALVLAAAAGVVGAVGVDDVVLDEGVPGPAVDGQVPVAARVERTTIVDGAIIVESAIVPHDSGHLKSYRPVPGFQPLPPTKLPVFFHWT